EMMIFDRRMPRSLVTCCSILLQCLELLADQPGTEAERQAGALASRLRYGRMDEVVDMGMQKFLQAFMEQLDTLTDTIVQQFMVSTHTGGGSTQSQRQTVLS